MDIQSLASHFSVVTRYSFDRHACREARDFTLNLLSCSADSGYRSADAFLHGQLGEGIGCPAGLANELLDVERRDLDHISLDQDLWEKQVGTLDSMVVLRNLKFEHRVWERMPYAVTR
jgi:hypothetical protein